MKFKVATLTAVIILVGIINLHSGMALLTASYFMSSSGSISYSSIRPLHVEGRYIKDDQNQTIYLRGANVGAWVDCEYGGFTAEGNYFGDDFWHGVSDIVKAELDWYASLGFNCVRSLMSVDWWKDNYHGYRDNYINFVTWCAEREIYVIVGFWSLTHYEEGGWSECTAFPYPPYIPEDYEYLMPDEQAFIDFWGSVAYRFRNHSNVIFDLWNEVGGEYAANHTVMNNWWATATGCINAIRNWTDAIVILTLSWGVDWDWNWSPEPGGYDPYCTMEWIDIYSESLPTDPNIMYDTHIYRDHGSFGGNHPVEGYPYTYDTIKEALNYTKVKWVLDTINRPMNIGEIGCNMYSNGQEVTAFQNAFAVFNEWGLHYQAWIMQPVLTMYNLIENEPYYPSLSAGGQELVDAIGG